jgi:hypothetical protein
MKKFLMICCLLAGIAGQVKGNTGLGSYITYGHVGPNLWQVSYIYVQDCSATPAAATLDLEISASGCAAARTVVLNKLNSSTVASPFCPNSSQTYCGGSGNATLNSYSALVTFASAEATCTSGIFLRVYGPNLQRAITANISGSNVLYNEAFLNLNAVNNSNGINSSPFLPPGKIPLATFIANSQVNFSVSAIDFEAVPDSFAYHLIPALQGSNTPVTYNGGLSSQMPFSSVTGVALDPVTGNLKFTAPPYVSGPGGTLNQANNRYTVVFEIKEYRKLAGVMAYIGSNRYEMMFEIEPATGNTLPQVANFTLNGQPFSPDQLQSIPVNRQSIIHFETVDADSWDQLTLDLFQNRTPANMNVVKTTGARPDVTITWTPTVADIQLNPINFSMKVEDNSCPIKGGTYKNLVVRVVNPTGLKSELDPDQKFNIFPNPFSEKVTFQFEGSKAAFSEVIIRNVLGQEIDRITLQNTAGGEQEINWKNASAFPAGQYLAQLIGKNTFSRQIKFMKLP